MIDLYRSIMSNQYQAALRTLEQSIDRTDNETWAAEHMDMPVNQVVFHTLFYADLYLGRGVPEFRNQPYHRERPGFFRDYEELEDRVPTHFYSRDECRSYLEFCVQKARTEMDGETAETLRADTGFGWRNMTRAELHVHNIRHIQHHAAQLGLRHQLAGGPPLRWVGGDA